MNGHTINPPIRGGDPHYFVDHKFWLLVEMSNKKKKKRKETRLDSRQRISIVQLSSAIKRLVNLCESELRVSSLSDMFVFLIEFVYVIMI